MRITKKSGKKHSAKKKKIEYVELNEEYYQSKGYEDEEEYYESEEYDGEEEYCESEEYDGEEEYCESEEYDGEEEYYESEEYEDDEEEYYESAEYDGEEEYCESEEYEDEEEEYYESEEYEDEEDYYGSLAADDGQEPEISMETMEMVPLDYAEEYEYEYESEKPISGKNPSSGKRKKHKKKTSGAAAFFSNLKHMTAMDRIVAATGAVVLCIVMVTCSVYASAKAADAQIAAFSEVSERLDSIGIAGESGLLAVADAELAKSETAGLFEEETESEEESGEVALGLNMTSVEKDLKIKFVNKKTKKLIPNVGFEVEVKGPDKKTVTWNDDDKDGIIYKKDLKPGNYQVTIQKSEALNSYRYDASAQSIKVKDKIEYNKIDVVDEIKTESQVNVTKEDTAIQEPEVAPALQDTVEWVESTKTPIEGAEGTGEYERVSKEDITDPLTFVSIAGFQMFAAAIAELPKTAPETPPEPTESTTVDEPETSTPGETDSSTPSEPESPSSSEPEESSSSTELGGGEAEDNTIKSVKINGDTVNVDIFSDVSLSAKAYNAGGKEVSASFDWSSSDTKIATVSNSGKVSAIKEGTTNITAKAGSASAVCRVTVKYDLSVSLKDVSVKVGESAKIESSISSNVNVEKKEWDTKDKDIIELSQDGTVKGKKAGTANVTLKATARGGKEVTATCKVTVGTSGFNVSLDKTELTVYSEMNNKSLKASVTGNANGDKYEWSSDNTKYVTVPNQNKNTVNITGVAPGTANITVKVTRGTETAAASCKVTVKLNPKKDTSTKLKDNDGNQLYIKKDGKYIEATWADYYTADKFYKKAKNIEYKYTGWQTLDGKTYYFTKDGEKVTGEQVIKGAKYTFNSEGVLQASSGVMGIDVSKWNGNIDWTAVRNSGVSYVIIRCGYRGSSTGAMIADPKFKSNIQGATNAGLKVGIYYFSQAVNEVEAVEEASMALSLIKGYKIAYPVFIDIEGSGGRGDRIDRNTRTAVANAFCQTIRNGGYTAGVYANKTWFESKMNTGSLTGYKLWLAQYAAAPTYKATRYDMWQYTSKGRINGIGGNVDLNISYLGY